MLFGICICVRLLLQVCVPSALVCWLATVSMMWFSVCRLVSCVGASALIVVVRRLLTMIGSLMCRLACVWSTALYSAGIRSTSGGLRLGGIELGGIGLEYKAGVLGWCVGLG